MSAMKASGLIRTGEYAKDEKSPDFSYLQLPIYLVKKGGDGPLYVYGTYPDWCVVAQTLGPIFSHARFI
jgi:hypothetical protein